MDPIINRYEDEEARAQAKTHLLKRISDYRKTGDSLSPQVRALVIMLMISNVTSNSWFCLNSLSHELFPFLQILDECNRAEQWLTEKSQQQELLPKNTEPLLWSSEIKTREADFDKYGISLFDLFEI